MKTNIIKCKLNESDAIEDYYTWEAFCDDCGKQLNKQRDILSSFAPNPKDKDLCVACMGKMIGINVED